MNPGKDTFIDFIFAATNEASSERREEIFRSVVMQTGDLAIASLFSQAADGEQAHREALTQLRFDFMNGRLALPQDSSKRTSRKRGGAR